MKRFYAILALVLPLHAMAQPSREAVLSTESSFVAQAAKAGATAAFLAHAAPGALVVEEGHCLPATEVWGRPSAGQQMNWKPVFADVAQSGDLAYTTGPRTLTQPGQPTTHQDFVTVWRRSAGKPWQYVFDTQVAHGPAAVAARNGVSIGHPELLPAAALPAAAPVKILLGIDEKFNQAALHLPAATYEQYLSAEARLYRPGQLPLVEAAMRATGPATGRAYLFVAQGGYLSDAADLGYVYGSLRRPTDAGPDETGSYLRIWRREGVASWRVVLEVLNPTQEQQEAPAILTANK